MIISTAWSSNGANANILMGEAEKIYMHVHLFFYISRFISTRARKFIIDIRLLFSHHSDGIGATNEELHSQSYVGSMFVLSLFSDGVRVPPSDFEVDQTEALASVISAKYINKVIIVFFFLVGVLIVGVRREDQAEVVVKSTMESFQDHNR